MQNSSRGLIKYGCNGLSCKCLNDVYRFDTRADVSPIERIKVEFTCQSNRCNQPLLPYLSNRSVLARYWTVATVFYQVGNLQKPGPGANHPSDPSSVGSHFFVRLQEELHGTMT